MSEPFHEANERLRERKRIENNKDAEIERLTDLRNSDKIRLRCCSERIDWQEERIAKLEAENKTLRDARARYREANENDNTTIRSQAKRIVKLEAVAEAAKKCDKGCRRCNSIDDRYRVLRNKLEALE